MRIWNLFLLFVVPSVHGADGPIDFSKAPGGGPSTLRACAQYAYNSNSRAGSVYDLGCSSISVRRASIFLFLERIVGLEAVSCPSR